MKFSSSMRLLAAVALVALPSLAFADTITFVAPNINLSVSGSPQTGYFDVVINDTASANHNLAAGGTLSSTNGTDAITGYSVEVQTAGGVAGGTEGAGTIAGGGTNSNAGVTFINSDDLTATGSPAGGPIGYLYSTDSVVDSTQNGSGFDTNFNNQDVFQQDVPSDNGPNLSGSLGLLRVEYVVPAGFSGVADLTIIISQPSGNLPAVWGDSAFNANTPLAVSGSITVTPEPTSMVLLVLGAVGLFGIRRLRSR